MEWDAIQNEVIEKEPIFAIMKMNIFSQMSRSGTK